MSSYRLTETAENLWGEEVTILAGASSADAFTTQGHALVGIQMPSGWDAAFLGYDVSVDNVTYNPAYDAGGNLQQTTAEASAFICIPLSQAIFSPYMRIKSVDSAGDPVVQTADRRLILMLRRYIGGS